MLAQHTWRKQFLSDFGALSKPKLHSRRPRIRFARWISADEQQQKRIWAIALEWPSTFVFFLLLVAVVFGRLKSKTFHFSFALNDTQMFIVFPFFFSFLLHVLFLMAIHFLSSFKIWLSYEDNMMIPINIGQNGFFAPCIIAMSIYYTNTQPRAMCAFYEPFLWWTCYSSKNSFDTNHSEMAIFHLTLCVCVASKK